MLKVGFNTVKKKMKERSKMNLKSFEGREERRNFKHVKESMNFN